jgi:pimeloyl-ACP methyl ester carboxylesterase
MKYAKRAAKGSLFLFILSFISLSLIGGYIGVRGNRVRYTKLPTQPYQEVTFRSEARDHITLSGWYLPANSEKTVIIVHGWGGHRARTLDLVEYLQRSGLNVLTFDLREGSGRNSYGEYESQDLSGAITWLQQEKHLVNSDLSIIGISMGATATVLYASQHPVGSIVLLGPIVDIKAAKQLILKSRHFILPGLYAAGATFVEQYIFGVRPVNPITIFYKISSPTLIMHADNDELSPATSIYSLKEQAEQRNQNNIEFVFLGNVGHKFIDNDKALGFPYAQEITAFIKQN